MTRFRAETNGRGDSEAARPGECAGLRREQPLARVGRSVTVVLHGRDAERARLAALLDGARGAGPGRCWCTASPAPGSPRCSRTSSRTPAATCGCCAPRAWSPRRRWRSPRCTGCCVPSSALLDRLPAPQARALRVAFGQEDGAAVEPFLVALATLSVLTDAAEDAPVLCVVDDAHWLDQASADALLFAPARLDADRVALVFAARDGDGPHVRTRRRPRAGAGAADRRGGPRAPRRGGRAPPCPTRSRSG